MMELGHRTAGETINFTEISDDKVAPEIIVYRFDYKALSALREKMMRREMVVSRYGDTRIDATLEADKPSLLFTSIPYDKGWTVHVDGKTCQDGKTDGSFPRRSCGGGKP